MTTLEQQHQRITATGARLYLCLAEALRRLSPTQRRPLDLLPAGTLEGLALMLASWLLRADVDDEVYGEQLPRLGPMWRALDALRAVIAPALQACSAPDGMRRGPPAMLTALRELGPLFLAVVLASENVQLTLGQLLAKFGAEGPTAPRVRQSPTQQTLRRPTAALTNAKRT